MIRAPIDRHTAPTATKMPHGTSISLSENSRQIEPSSARMLHFTGLRLLSAFIKLGMNKSGTIPPPNIAMNILALQAAPDTASSVLPITDISIMMPTKQNAMHNAAIANNPKLRGRIPSETPNINITTITPITAR